MKAKQTKRRLSLLTLLLACPACIALDPVSAAAELRTYEWAAPMLTRYVQADPTLDESAKATHLRGIDAWRQRVTVDAAATGAK